MELLPLNSIICGDALLELKKMPSESVDLCITSPPYYALRDYQVEGQLGLEPTFEEYLKKILAITAEIKRVLKKSGQFWLNLGDIYGGTRWSGKGQGQPINKFRDGYRDINPVRGFDKKNYGGLGQKRQDTTRQGRGRGEGDASKCLMMMPERIAIAMCDDDGDDIYELREDLTEEERKKVLTELLGLI